MRDLLGYPLRKARAQLSKDARWPVLHLPLTLAAEFALPPDVAEDLTCACLLLYGFADLADDAQDGDLQGDWGWERAVNAGFALSFLGQEVLSELDLPASARLDLTAAFARTGRLMTFGQEGDLRATSAHVPSVAEYMETVTGKTGASVAFFAAAPAIAALRPRATVELLSAYGMALGIQHQIASDLTDFQQPAARGSDARNRKVTLPLIYGLDQDRSGRIRSWLEGDGGDAPERSAPSLDIATELAALGTGVYCRMQAQLQRRKALSCLDELDLSNGARAELAAYLSEQATSPSLEL
jgi:geranylgeranyl pyrophosphate synthase